MSLWADTRELLKAYKDYDPAAKSVWEIALLYPGPKAIAAHRISHFLYKKNFYFLARLVAEISRSMTLIEIHPGATIGRRLVIDHGAGIVIGETAEIGDDCLIFHGVTLGGMKFDPVKRHPTLGNRVLVGAGAKVLGPIHIGNGCRIGANCLVTKNMEAMSTVVTQPAQTLIPHQSS